MCGRYFYDEKTAYDISSDLNIDVNSSLMRNGDITPAMSPVVIAADKTSNDFDLRVAGMFWGLPGKYNKLIINARAESVQDRSMFTEAFEKRRLIIPAAGFYEWDKDRNKVTFRRKDSRPIYLAGFYTLSDNRDSFVIMTTAANESMIKVHDRMPLMIEKQHVKDWLYDGDAAKDMLSAEMPLLDSRVDYEQLSLF